MGRSSYISNIKVNIFPPAWRYTEWSKITQMRCSGRFILNTSITNQNPNQDELKRLSRAFKLYFRRSCKELSPDETFNRTCLQKVSARKIYLHHRWKCQCGCDSVYQKKKKKVRLSTIYHLPTALHSVFANYYLQKGWIRRYPEKIRSARKSSKRGETQTRIVFPGLKEFEKLVEYFLKKDKEFSFSLMFLWHTRRTYLGNTETHLTNQFKGTSKSVLLIKSTPVRMTIYLYPPLSRTF